MAVGGVNDEGDRELLRLLAGALLMDYDAVEGTGVVLPSRLYIEAAGAVRWMRIWLRFLMLSFLIGGGSTQRQGRQ